MEGRSASNCRRNGVIRPSLLKGQHQIKTESLLTNCGTAPLGICAGGASPTIKQKFYDNFAVTLEEYNTAL